LLIIKSDSPFFLRIAQQGREFRIESGKMQAFSRCFFGTMAGSGIRKSYRRRKPPRKKWGRTSISFRHEGALIDPIPDL
jgi:hypothetical protein